MANRRAAIAMTADEVAAWRDELTPRPGEPLQVVPGGDRGEAIVDGRSGDSLRAAPPADGIGGRHVAPGQLGLAERRGGGASAVPAVGEPPRESPLGVVVDQSVERRQRFLRPAVGEERPSEQLRRRVAEGTVDGVGDERRHLLGEAQRLVVVASEQGDLGA